MDHEYVDARHDLHRDCPDYGASDEETLADLEADLLALLSGDTGMVPPWSTPEATQAELEGEIARLREKTTGASPAGV